MNRKYLKRLNLNAFFIENIEDNKKRHELEAVMYNKDIMDKDLKENIEEIKNY